MVSNSKTNNTQDEVLNRLFTGIRTIANRRKTPWIGTMTELNDVIINALRGRISDEVSANWPPSPSSLRLSINRILKDLKRNGVRVNFTRSTDQTRTRLVEIST